MKAVNNIISFYNLNFTLLVFKFYSYIYNIYLLIPSIIQKILIVKKVKKKVKKIYAKNSIINASNTKKRVFINLIHKFLLNSNMLILQKSNIR